MTAEESPVRRSTRTRRQAHSIYDEARVSLDSVRSQKKQRRNDDSDDDSDEVLSMQDDFDGSDSDDSSVDERRRKSKKKKASPAAKMTTSSSSSPAAKKSPRRRKKTKPTRKNAKAALTTLAKKVLRKDDETPENSIVAALLQPETDLQELARRVVQDNPDQCVTKVVLLLFRSVGAKGVVPDNVDLETCSEEDLADVLQIVVEEMEQADTVLFPCVPAAAVGLREYRTLFESFWYQLGMAVSTGAASQDDGDDEKGSREQPGEESSAEMARDVLSRLTDLVNVGITDLRNAATTAVYQMGAALLDRTSELQSKIDTAERQKKVAQRNKQARKKSALQQQITVWTKLLQDLQEMVDSIVVAVFLKRYKDVHPQIRTLSIQMLAKYARIRPDLFLQNSFLKYMGWLLSDKDAMVREAAVRAFLAPLQELDDCSSMTHATEKFLPRLCDCLLDVEPSVQDAAMELFLVLMRKGFLENLEDDDIWDQINLRALAPDASQATRDNALLFVLEQLESFDSVDRESGHGAVEKINALVKWIVHNLAEGDIPIEHVRYERTDLVVESLRASTQHRSLVCNWSAMMSALDSETHKTVQDDDDEEDDDASNSESRLNAVKQRVLLRFIVCAAEMEASPEESAVHDLVDPELIHLRQQRAKKTKTTTSSHEELTLALLGALPELLVAYKTETPVLESLTGLPKYFLPSVFNLSSRKKDFVRLVKNLSAIFLESTNAEVLDNCALALASLGQGDHSRTRDAEAALKKTVRTLQSRLLELLQVKAAKEEGGDNGSKSGDDDEEISLVNTQQSISLCLRRLSILSKRVYVGELLIDSTVTDAQDEAVEGLFNTVAEYVAKELNSRKIEGEESVDEEESVFEIPPIWENADKQIHSLVAEAVCDGLNFSLCVTAWRLETEIESKEDGEYDADKEHIVLRMREYLMKLCALCYEQHLRGSNMDAFSKEHQSFSIAVQKQAGNIVGDLRSLFPDAWATSTSPFLSACGKHSEHPALTGGMLRFLSDMEGELRACEKDEEKSPVAEELLLPLARGLTANWLTCNRREAGAALAHIVGSGVHAGSIVSSMSRVFKKIRPVRLLEAQMACLCQSFDYWYNAEPGDLDDRPTDEELAAFEEEEENHKQMFKLLEDRAARLSSSLGVGKLSGEGVNRAIRFFLREGIRFAFSTDSGNEEEEFAVGARLAFLRVLSKYLMWVKRDRETKKFLHDYLTEKEAELRDHPEFDDVLDEDKEALSLFREAGNLAKFVHPHGDQHTAGSFEEQTQSQGQASATSSRHPRSTPGSVGSSVRSKRSVPSLPPVYEEGSGEEGSGESPSPPKRFKLTEDRSVSSVHTQESIREGSNEDDTDSD